MVDTPRTLAALQALLADNTSGQISPQNIRDFLVTVEYIGHAATKIVVASGAATGWPAVTDAASGVYVCDGTADNVEIQAAITALPTGGGTVVLSDGTFNLATALVPKGGTVLRGQGPSTVLFLVNGANSRVIEYLASAINNIWIEYLVVDGNGANQSNGAASTDRTAIQLANITNVRINRITFQNARHGQGIRISGATVAEVSDCYGLNNGTTGAAFASDHILVADSFFVDVHDNYLLNCTDTGVALDGNQYASNHNNRVVGAGVQCMSVASSASLVGQQVVVSSPILQGTADTQNGILITNTGAGNTTLISIVNPLITSVNAGISVDNVTHCVISNPFISCASTGTARYAIEVGASAFGVKIDGGKIRNCAEGIHLNASAAALTINGLEALDTVTAIFGTTKPAAGSNITILGYVVAPVAQTVGSSPYTYTAGVTRETVHIRGGTVSAVVKSGITLYTATGCAVPLLPGEAVVITYSVLPTVVSQGT
jgi:hypothetical protein